MEFDRGAQIKLNADCCGHPTLALSPLSERYIEAGVFGYTCSMVSD
jgi:hypothetical protein